MTQLILDEYNLKILKKLLKQWVPNALVLAYGSRIKGNAHSGSDLDLILQNPNHPEAPNNQLDELHQEIIESNITILIDIKDWALLPETFRQEIKKQHVIIQQPYPKLSF
jgi:predicted nucleotidyltransferase